MPDLLSKFAAWLREQSAEPEADSDPVVAFAPSQPSPGGWLSARPANSLRDDFRTLLARNPLLAVPSVTADGGQLGSAWVAAAALTGLRHLQHAQTGQDAYAFSSSESAITAATCDGVGSQPRTSQIGALAASRLLTRSLHALDRVPLAEQPRAARAAVLDANRKLLTLRAQLFPDAQDGAFATTAAGVWIDQDRANAVFLRIGDTGAFVIQDGHFTDLFPDSSARAVNEVTNTIPKDGLIGDAVEVAAVQTEPGDVVVLVTDGLKDDIRDSPPLQQALARAWSSPCTSFDCLRSLRYRRHGSFDDRAVVLIWPQLSPSTLDNVHSRVHNRTTSKRRRRRNGNG